MSFCIAIKVQDGLVGIADTRVTTGTQAITARKVTSIQHGKHCMFLMTSGLRSARDKALTYFHEMLEEKDDKFDQAVPSRERLRANKSAAWPTKTAKAWRKAASISICTS
jgi:predicted proteasome-type protease